MPKHHRRNRNRRPARRAPFLEPKPRILVVCEGEITEPQYLTGFKNAWHNPRVDVEIHPRHGVDPKTLVEEAKKRKQAADRAAENEEDENLRYDSVWAVFDRDDHAHIPDAVQMARDNGIELAISNPSFELWLLLHFRESPGMKDRKAVVNLLKKHVKHYDKSVDFEQYRDGYDQAARRAQNLQNQAIADGDPTRNPTTGVHKLTESIRVN
jgi:hypothetical protein